jgi:hypothetical protein
VAPDAAGFIAAVRGGRVKRSLLLWIVVCLLAGPAPCLVAFAQDAQQVLLSQPVADPRGRFIIQFPGDWEVATRPQGMIALVGAAPGTGSRPSVNVVIEPLPHPLSAEKYAAAAQHLAEATLHNYTVVQESGTTVRGRPAYYRYLTWETNTGVTLYQLQAFFTAGTTGFVVTGTTVNDRDRILRDMPVITRIIETFQVRPAADSATP